MKIELFEFEKLRETKFIKTIDLPCIPNTNSDLYHDITTRKSYIFIRINFTDDRIIAIVNEVRNEYFDYDMGLNL